MKIWHSFGSEHSANLVMIGHFQNTRDAEVAKEIIDRITEQVATEIDAGTMEVGEGARKYSDTMLKFLQSLNITSIGPSELEQFAYDVRVKQDGDKIVVTTDEIDVCAFLRLLFDRGARVEVYSAHDYPDTEYGRGK